MGGSFDDLKKLSSARKASVDSARPRLRKSTTENDDDLKDDDEDALKEEEEEEEFEFNEHHALTLTGLSGKRLKRELSRHQLFQGLEDTQSPETTPGGTLTMESAQTLAAETDLIRDAKVVSGAGGRDEYLYQQQKVEEESGSHGNNNNNNNASGNGGGGGGIKHAPSLAQIFGTANAAGNNSSSPAGMERSSSPSLSPQHKQMLREYTMNKNKEQLSNNNNNNSNNNNNNEKNKSSATNLQHANTLSGASSKFLAEEIRHMRDDPSLDKKTKTKKSKSTTIKEGEELMVMAPDGTTKKKKNAKEVDEVLDQGQRRLALRSVQRTTEDLLLISDALKTKEATLGSLPTRLERLELIKDNITRIHRSEGLLEKSRHGKSQSIRVIERSVWWRRRRAIGKRRIRSRRRFIREVHAEEAESQIEEEVDRHGYFNRHRVGFVVLHDGVRETVRGRLRVVGRAGVVARNRRVARTRGDLEETYIARE